MSTQNNNGRLQFVRVPGGVVRVADPFTVLERQMGRLLEEFKEPASGDKPARLGATDVTEDTKGYTIAIEVPGCQESDIKLSASGGTLVISGEKKRPEQEEGARQHLAGRVFSTFEESFTIPENADADKISATLKNGVLTVTLPHKAEVRPAERTIAIQSA